MSGPGIARNETDLSRVVRADPRPTPSRARDMVVEYQKPQSHQYRRACGSLSAYTESVRRNSS